MVGRVLCLLAGCLALLPAPMARGELRIGEPAPEVSLTDWVRGEPVSLAKGKGTSVFLIEFWATWCPPCIELIPHNTELQSKYERDGLVVLGVTGPGRGESLSKVKRFVRQRGDAMAYTVAYDAEGATHARYMGGVGAAGIPYAFIVDRTGNLVWHGHPGDPLMDEIIHDVIKGKFDVTQAALREQLTPLFSRMQRQAGAGEWDEFKKTATEILVLDPRNEAALDAVTYAYLPIGNDGAGFRSFVEGYIEKHRQDAEAMHVLAVTLQRIETLDLRQPDLALKAASAAYEACKGGNCAMIDTYARAVFEIGMVDRAIELQSKAVAKADDDEERTVMQRVLDYYKTCKSLQSEQL